MRTPKYDPLERALRAAPAHQAEVAYTFKQIEDILGETLPPSAYQHQAWWANQSDATNRPHAHAWLTAGFTVDAVHQQTNSGWVRFRRRGAAAGPRRSISTTTTNSIKGNNTMTTTTIGDKIRHETFGLGIVLEVKPETVKVRWLSYETDTGRRWSHVNAESIKEVVETAE